MNMKELFDIREMLCDELSEFAGKQEMGTGELDVIHKLTASIKNIDKIALFESGGYSRNKASLTLGPGQHSRHLWARQLVPAQAGFHGPVQPG